MAENSHPNWRALSTINFQYKRFVKATDAAAKEQQEQAHLQSEALNGEEVMDFYKEVTKDTVKKEETFKVEEEVKKKVVDVEDIFDEDVCVVDPFAGRKLLLAAQSGDIDAVKQALCQSKDEINCLDGYGWTPLMVASAAGSASVVQFLLYSGADVHKADKGGHTAADIARKKGHFVVEKSLLTWKESKKTISKGKQVSDNFETCDLCNEIYPINERKKHQASVVHQLELDKSQLNLHPGFSISQTNKGYQLLKKSGWDGVSGLGGAHKGRLFPVKSVLKTNRDGLKEGMGKSAKITHFAANDVESIKAQTRGVQKKRKFDQTSTHREILIRESLGNLF